jgi:hypothetical protein
MLLASTTQVPLIRVLVPAGKGNRGGSSRCGLQTNVTIDIDIDILNYLSHENI